MIIFSYDELASSVSRHLFCIVLWWSLVKLRLQRHYIFR